MNSSEDFLQSFLSSSPPTKPGFYVNVTVDGPPPRWQTWIYGFAAVSVCSYAAPLGILLLPFLRKSLYERVMTFLVALGIGAVSSNALFVMIPQAFTLNILEGLLYRNKSATILAAIYVFLAVDRLLQLALGCRNGNNGINQRILDDKLKRDDIKAVKQEGTIEKDERILQEELENAVLNNFTWGKSFAILGPVDDIEFKDHNGQTIPIRRKLGHLTACSSPRTTVDRRKPGETAGIGMDSAKIANKTNDNLSLSAAIMDPVSHQLVSVAYMLIIGSSANNFVDGMSLGAGFSDNIMRGVSIGIAVFSQQLPQEIGTLAIIIKSLGMRRALLLNTVPIFLSYIGFAAGVILDTLDDSYGSYIFAVSAGMYLYVFLGTLIPEMRESTNQLIRQDLKESLLVTVLQIAGIAVGVSLMAFMSSISELDLN